GMVYQLPWRVAQRARETQEVREVDSKTSVLSAQVHRKLRGDMEDRIVRVLVQEILRRNGFPQREPSDQIRVFQRRDEDPCDRVCEQLRELVGGGDCHALSIGPFLQ